MEAGAGARCWGDTEKSSRLVFRRLSEQESRAAVRSAGGRGANVNEFFPSTGLAACKGKHLVKVKDVVDILVFSIINVCASA